MYEPSNLENKGRLEVYVINTQGGKEEGGQL